MEDITAGNEPRKIPLVTSQAATPKADHHGDSALSEFLALDFRYVPTLEVEGRFASQMQDDSGCSCEEPSCSDPDADCECSDTYGHFYDADGCLQLEVLPPRLALYECSEVCSCRSLCKNVVVQRGVSQGCYVKAVEGKGLGLFAGQEAKKGSFLCLYAGEVISTGEARRRWQNQLLHGKDNYILVVKEVTTQQGRTQVLKTTVDPTKIGNIGRFMNHACPPATTHIMLPIRPAGSLIPLPALFAVRDIACHEELTWDYQDAGGESWFYGREPEKGAGELTAGRIPCKCGSSSCRGWIPYDPDL